MLHFQLQYSPRPLHSNMSYQSKRPYARSLLRPLAPQAQRSSFPKTGRSEESQSDLWTATTHVFVGTSERVEHPAWSPDQFDKSPAEIPDDSRWNTSYNPASAESRPGNVYHIFALKEGPKSTSTVHVPGPNIVVKRYLPNSGFKAGDHAAKFKSTLLVLPGMNAPKEVSRAADS